MFSLNWSEDVLSKSLCADLLVLMSERIKGIRNNFLRWKEAFENLFLILTLGKIFIMVSSGIKRDGMSESKVDPCGVYSLTVKTNSVLYGQCDMWIHGRCARVRRVAAKC